MKGVITLGDMQAKGMRMLEVACRKCARRGRLSIARLIADHGRDDHGDLCALICERLTADAEPRGVDLRAVRHSFSGFAEVVFDPLRPDGPQPRPSS